MVANEFILELSGFMAPDLGDAGQTELSKCTAHKTNSGPKGRDRLLVGPIRFINHDCKNSNVEVSLQALVIIAVLIHLSALSSSR